MCMNMIVSCMFICTLIAFVCIVWLCTALWGYRYCRIELYKLDLLPLLLFLLLFSLLLLLLLLLQLLLYFYYYYYCYYYYYYFIIVTSPSITPAAQRHSPGTVTSTALIFNPIQTHFTQITQLCGLCCLEGTAVKLVCSDVFLQTRAVTMQFLLLAGRQKLCTITKTLQWRSTSNQSSDNAVFTSSRATEVVHNYKKHCSDVLLQTRAVTMQLLLLAGRQKLCTITKTLQ